MTEWVTGLIALPSALWLIGICRWLAQSKPIVRPQNEESVEVVVVARNEEQTITACIQALIRQKYSLNKISVIDDASEDSTLELANAIATVNNNVHVFSIESNAPRVSPKKYALAMAFRNATSQKIALTDADCVVPTEWIQSMTNEIDDNIGAVIGASWPRDAGTIQERIYRCERLIANTLMASACGWGSPASACGHSIVYSTKALHHVDAPVRRDLPSGDDDLTVQAIAKAGWKVRFCSNPKSVVQDLGGLRGSRWSQASRHQSVTHLYPLRWRILFIAVVFVNIMTIGILISAPFLKIGLPLLIAVIGKSILDSSSGILLARKLKLDISVAEIFLASLFLPFWSLWRAVAGLFGSSFEWRGRNMGTLPTSN